MTGLWIAEALCIALRINVGIYGHDRSVQELRIFGNRPHDSPKEVGTYTASDEKSQGYQVGDISQAHWTRDERKHAAEDIHGEMHGDAGKDRARASGNETARQ